MTSTPLTSTTSKPSPTCPSESLDMRPGASEDVKGDIPAVTIMARALKSQGLKYAFGVVGVPVTPLVEAMQREGINFVAMRNEQSASYAASVVGYLTQLPGICITVAGPGFLHAVPGLLNASANCWPMILISSSSWTSRRHQGAFQEAEQMEAARPYIKFGTRVESVTRFPYLLEQAVRTSLYGRPGAVYLELARETLTQSAAAIPSFPQKVPPPPLTSAHPDQIAEAVRILYDSKKPLVVVGKAAAYYRCEKELRYLSESRRLPVLPSSMAKGLLPDNHDNVVSAARSVALKETDCIILLGARLNWTFEFGEGPKMNPEAKIIQIESTPEHLHMNRPADVALVGDGRTILSQILAGIGALPSQQRKEWWDCLSTVCRENRKGLTDLCNNASSPMSYHYVLSRIDAALPQGSLIVNEGANTMDVGRIVLSNSLPRSRLDAGTNGTMGLGLGYAIASAVIFPSRKVVAVLGDSAFGFCAMEVEVACRYKLPITFIVINNNGIYAGESQLEECDPTTLSPLLLSPSTHYGKIIEACGGKGFEATSPETLDAAVAAAIACPDPCLLNIFIDPHSAAMPSSVRLSARSSPSRTPMTNEKLAARLQ